MTKRVLIVDDEPAVIKGLTDCFQCFEHGHAYEITSAGSAREALAIAQREGFGFDLILLELHITWIGEPFHQVWSPFHALDLLKQIRERGAKVPVIMMCGFDPDENEAEALAAGAFAYLQKPFDLRVLDPLVARALGSGPRAPGG